jgi:competence protein ComGC
MVTWSRQGFTRIECLVVLAIGIVLTGLLVPGVQKAKEEKLRTECDNNLHAVGIATHNFAWTHHRLPSNPGTDGKYSGTVQWLLLPYME